MAWVKLAGTGIFYMTYSLHTLQSSAPRPAAAPTGFARFANEMALVAGFVLLAIWLLAMLSYSPLDAAWSTSGTGVAVLNRAGRLGAWIADMSYFLLGYSVWWALAVALRQWLSLLAQRLRGDGLPGEGQATGAEHTDVQHHRWTFWLGLALLLYGSCTLEWSRMYRFETLLPGHGGGVLGYVLGSWSVRWLGFAGSGLVAIALGVVGCALVFRFSWMHVAERLGAWAYSFVEQQREKRELAQDMEIGQQAMREREEVVFEEREEIVQHHAPPVIIVEQPAQPEVAQSLCSLRCRTASCRKWPCWTRRSCARKPYRPTRWR
jgi:DNA segregation ATPase FtsK/SpoIIIE, S-DNA-T family